MKLGKVKWIGQGPEPVRAESGIKHVYMNPMTQALSAVRAISQQRATWNIEKVPHALRTLEGLCLWTGPVSVAADCLPVSQKYSIFLAAELPHNKNYELSNVNFSCDTPFFLGLRFPEKPKYQRFWQTHCARKAKGTWRPKTFMKKKTLSLNFSKETCPDSG